MLSYTNSSFNLSFPFATNVASFALVPVPHGDLSTCPEPNITTFCNVASGFLAGP